MSARRRELVATNKSTVIAKMLLDAIVVEGREGDGSFPDPPWTDESDRFEVFGKVDYFLDQEIPPKTSLQGWRRKFSEGDTMRDVRFLTDNICTTNLA